MKDFDLRLTHFPAEVGTGSELKMRHSRDLERFSGSVGSEYALARTDEGFSLIELLIGIALAALIGVLLVQSLATARQGLAYHARLTHNGDILAARDYLQNVLLQAQPLAGNAGGNGELSFAGEPGMMSFLSTHVPNASYGGVYHVNLALEPSPSRDGKLDLIVRHRLYRPRGGGSDKDDSNASTVALVRNITAAEFQYFVPAVSGNGQNSQLAWSPNWRHATVLPALVAITMTFSPSDSRVWPRLNVPVYAAASNVTCPPRVACH